MSRFQLGVCEWSVRARGRALMELTKRCELDCVQLGVGMEIMANRGLADKATVQEYRQASEETGVEIVSLSPQFVDNYSFTCPQNAQDEAVAMELCTRTIDLLQTFDCRNFLLPVLCRNTICDGVSFHRAVERIRILADMAADKGAMTCLEINLSLAKVYDLLDAVNRDDVKIFFDSQNLFALDGTSMARYYTELARQHLIGGIHLKDGIDNMLSGSLLGDGNSGFERTAKAIAESDYRGCILTESVYANPTVAHLGSEEELLARDAVTMKRYFT